MPEKYLQHAPLYLIVTMFGFIKRIAYNQNDRLTAIVQLLFGLTYTLALLCAYFL